VIGHGQLIRKALDDENEDGDRAAGLQQTGAWTV
jgi:hypothetical protein